MEHIHTTNDFNLRSAQFNASEMYTTHDRAEALRMARAYLATARYFTVAECEVPVEFANLTGRFDALVDVDAEQAMQASADPAYTGMLVPGRWILDYKTCYNMERFDSREYFWGPQGRAYEHFGQKLGYKGMVFAAVSRDHPSQVAFHVHPFECDPLLLACTMSSFIVHAEEVAKSTRGKDLRDCFKYGKLCPHISTCFGVSDDNNE
jgi:hypothetical protein